MEGYKEGALTEYLESTKKIKIDKNDRLAAMFGSINGKAYPLISKGKSPERIPTDKCRKVPKRKCPEIPTDKCRKVAKRKYPEIAKASKDSTKSSSLMVERKRKKVKSVGDQAVKKAKLISDLAVKKAKLKSPSEKDDVNETSTVTDPEDTKETIKRDTQHTKKLRKLVRKTGEQNLEVQKRTIFVGNISTSSTKKEIEQIFRQYGKIQSVRLRSISVPDLKLPKKVAAIKKTFHENRNTFNAYVLFECQDSAEAALVHNGHVYNGFHLRVDRSTGNKPTKLHMKRSVFVGNMSYETEEEAVRKHFSDCGEIEGVRIIRDRITGVGKGFGYVLFKSADSVQLAIRMNEASFLEGRKIRVKRSVSKKSTKNASGDQIRRKNGLEPRSPRTPGSSFQGLEGVPLKNMKKKAVKNRVNKQYKPKQRGKPKFVK